MSLYEHIRSLRFRNFECRFFVPYEPLSEILTKDSILDVLQDCGIEVYDQDGIATRVLNGAQRVFAILACLGKVQVIRKFIENDIQIAQLDQKLPISYAELSLILGDGQTAADFCELQWEFAVPSFPPRIASPFPPQRY